MGQAPAPPADTHIPTQPAADNWSLGASLFWCWTGRRPVAYDDTIDRLEKSATIVKGTTTALRGIRPWPFLEFEEAVTACLAPAPADRPTGKEPTAAWCPCAPWPWGTPRPSPHPQRGFQPAHQMALFYCTKVVGRWADEAAPKLAPARIAAERMVGELQAR